MKDPSKGLIYAYELNQKGQGRPLAWEDIATWRPESGVLWLHLDASDPGLQGDTIG